MTFYMQELSRLKASYKASGKLLEAKAIHRAMKAIERRVREKQSAYVNAGSVFFAKPVTLEEPKEMFQ